jgi:stringent starvation protein B
MTSKSDPRPHLMPAVFQWMCENFQRIHLHAVAKHEGVIIPPGVPTKTIPCGIRVKNDNGPDSIAIIAVDIITLNFGFNAINSFYQNSTGFGCKMRFNGVSHDVFLPFGSIIVISSPDDEDGTGTSAFPLYYGQEILANTPNEVCNITSEVNSNREERLSRTMKVLTDERGTPTAFEPVDSDPTRSGIQSEKKENIVKQRPSLRLVKNDVLH